MAVPHPLTLADIPLRSDDLDALPDDLERRELIGGELIVAPSPLVSHQDRLGQLYELFSGWRGIPGVGKPYLAPLDVRLSDRDTVQPDLFFVRWERHDRFVGDRRFDGPPDIVVEVVSPSSRRLDRVRKLALYERAGVPEYWVVDPTDGTLTIHVLRNGRYEAVLADADGRMASTVVPGLAISAADLFGS